MPPTDEHATDDPLHADSRADAPAPVELGGDAVCWLDRVCDTCGALADGPAAAVCERCGAPRRDPADADLPAGP